MQKETSPGKKPGLGALAECIKGYWLPTVLTPLLMVCEVVMEVLSPCSWRLL